MPYVSSCSRGPGLNSQPACRGAMGTLLCSWSRFIRLRQARHVYFKVDTQTDSDRAAPQRPD